MEKDTIVYIYKRKEVKKDDEFSSYVYEPSEVLEGSLIEFDGNTVFIDDKDNHYPSMTDGDNMDDEFVYAFPYDVTGISKDRRKKIEKKLNDEFEHLYYYLIFQIYIEGDQYVQAYFSPDELQSFIGVDADNYNGLVDMLTLDYNKFEELKKSIKIKKEKEESEEEKSKTDLGEKVEPPRPIIYSDDIYDNVSKTVICQDEQVKEIATAIAKNQRLTNPSLKSNLLVCGPTGVGKTEIFKTISRYTKLPIAIEDSTEYTAASYKGKDVTEMLMHLYENAGRNLESAQRGILVIDEIDKKVSSGDHATYTSAVIECLLKMMEGHTYALSDGNKGEIYFDTSYLSFAFLGAFSGIEKYMKDRREIGFGASSINSNKTKSNKESYNNETLKKFGLLPEFVGRNDTIVVMDNLEVPEFIRIINESDKSQLMLYKKFFEGIGIDFQFDEETVEAIAKEAYGLGIGARGIKRIVENALAVANYYALSKQQYKRLIITPKTIKDNKDYTLE